MLDKGKILVDPSGPTSMSYGLQSPASDAVPLTWSLGDRRYRLGSGGSSGPSAYTAYWVCIASGTPGTWVEVKVPQASIDLFLSYGMGFNSGALPQPPEASPSFYLRPDTDYTVPQSFILSPGSVCEWPCGITTPAGRASLQLFVYSCGLSGSSPYLIVQGTRNGIPNLTGASSNLNGLNNVSIDLPAAGPPLSPDDRIGVLVSTGGLGSGFLVMTAHLKVLLDF